MSSDAEQLMRQVSELSVAGLPLAEGLRAAAEESSSERLAAALRAVADQVEQGRALDQVLADRALPSHVSGLVRAAARTGQLGRVLTELVQHQRRMRQQRRLVASALAYPALLLSVTLALFLVFMFWVVPPMALMLRDFELTLPAATEVLFWWSETGVWLLLGCGAAAALGLTVARVALGAARCKRVAATVPLIGPLGHWSGVAEMARLLGLLVEQGVPLPEALRLAADGVQDANVGQVCRALAVEVEQGRPLSELLAATHRLPAPLVPLVRWGEQTGALDEALRTAGEMFEKRVELRALLLKSVCPPVMLVVVVGVAWPLVTGLFLPLVSLIQGLS